MLWRAWKCVANAEQSFGGETYNHEDGKIGKESDYTHRSTSQRLTIEQWMLAVVVTYHGSFPESRYPSLQIFIKTLLQSHHIPVLRGPYCAIL
jgi:hypothetical protein